MQSNFKKDIQFYKFCLYGFFKNLKFFDAFLLLFFLSKGLDYWQIGLIYTTREITRNILEIPSGVISDSLGRRKSLVVSFITYILSYLIFYLSESFGVIIIAMFVYAVGDAFRTGTHKSMIYSYLKMNGWSKHKTEYYGYTRSWSQIGSAICSLGGAAFLWFTGSYSSIFIFSIIPTFLDAILIASYPKSLEGEKKSYKESVLNSFKITLKSFGAELKNISFYHNTNLVSLHSGFYKTIKDYLQPIIIGLAVSIPLLQNESEFRRESLWVGVIYFIIYLASSRASSFAGKVSSKFSNNFKALNITMYVGLFLGMIGGFFAGMDFELVAVILLIGVFIIENLRKPIGVGNIADNTQSGSWASVLSFQSQTASLYAAILAPFLGLLADFFGPGYALSLISLIALFYSIITEKLYLMFDRKSR